MKRTFCKLTVDIDEAGAIDVEDLDVPMIRVVNDVEYALTKQRDVLLELRTLGSDILQLFVTTHKSMRSLIQQGDPLLANDALSLCREQVEKLFVLTLVAQEPEKWINQYLR